MQTDPGFIGKIVGGCKNCYAVKKAHHLTAMGITY